jgi:hypothetical protein
MIGIQGEGAVVTLSGRIVATIPSPEGLQSIVDVGGNRIAVPYASLSFERRADS